MSEPAVVALGGGHGLAATLRALRRYARSITAVVSVADDGGSSGRLRQERGLPPPGDLRKCLVALAHEESPWHSAFEHRFRGGTLDGHALGNLIIAGLAEALGDFGAAIEEVGRLLGSVGDVVPATTEPVVIKADVEGRAVEGQVAVSHSTGRIGRVGIVPADARAPAQAVQAIVEADQVVLAPGSLYTSLVPVICVRDLCEALRASTAQVVQVSNLRPQVPETQGLSASDHLRVVLEHGARVDVFVAHRGAALPLDAHDIRSLGTELVVAEVADGGNVAHDPEKLGSVLAELALQK